MQFSPGSIVTYKVDKNGILRLQKYEQKPKINTVPQDADSQNKQNEENEEEQIGDENKEKADDQEAVNKNDEANNQQNEPQNDGALRLKQIKVIKGHNLPSDDSADFKEDNEDGAKSKVDCYVTVKYGNQKFKTDTISNGEDTEWNESFDLDDGSEKSENVQSANKIVFEIIDNEANSDNELMARCEIGIEDLEAGKERYLFPLMDKEGVAIHHKDGERSMLEVQIECDRRGSAHDDVVQDANEEDENLEVVEDQESASQEELDQLWRQIGRVEAENNALEKRLQKLEDQKKQSSQSSRCPQPSGSCGSSQISHCPPESLCASLQRKQQERCSQKPCRQPPCQQQSYPPPPCSRQVFSPQQSCQSARDIFSEPLPCVPASNCYSQVQKQCGGNDMNFRSGRGQSLDYLDDFGSGCGQDVDYGSGCGGQDVDGQVDPERLSAFQELLQRLKPYGDGCGQF